MILKKPIVLLCLNATGTKGYLQKGAIYTVTEAEGSYYRVHDGWYMASRFKTVEQPVTDNTLSSPLLDKHNAEESVPPDERKGTQTS